MLKSAVSVAVAVGCLTSAACEAGSSIAGERWSGDQVHRLSDAVTDIGAAAATGGRAGGHAEVHGTTVQNVVDESYSFTAVSSQEFPLAKGEVEVHFLRFSGETVAVHAAVSCLAIQGNMAWVGAVVSHFTIDQQDQPELVGRPMILRVQDLGEGDGVADLGSLAFFPPAGSAGDLAHCATQPSFPILRVSDNGNIQVTPR